MSPLLRGKKGLRLGRCLVRLLSIHRVNRVYENSIHLRGAEFAASLLKDVGVSYEIENEEQLSNLPEGTFITVSNHPYGGLDGVIMIDIMVRRRPDYKFMVNSILMNVRTMADNFVGVQPATAKSSGSNDNALKLKETIRHMKEGHPMGFFPAGAVSNFHKPNWFQLTDRDWQPTVIRLIQAAKAPVIPIFFHGKNSCFFNFLGRVNWQLRSMRMPYEVFNKRGKTIKVTIGDPISWEEQKQYAKVEELAAFLKARTYALSKKG
nr:lysophospholipid acyltransferase family protein [Parabacteroides sp. FAFU027]